MMTKKQKDILFNLKTALPKLTAEEQISLLGGSIALKMVAESRKMETLKATQENQSNKQKQT